MRKRKKIWANDAERLAWDAKVDEDIRRARELVRKGRAELGIPEPEDKLAYTRQLVARGRAELAARRLLEQSG